VGIIAAVQKTGKGQQKSFFSPNHLILPPQYLLTHLIDSKVVTPRAEYS
jgi:hypothetical protein